MIILHACWDPESKKGQMEEASEAGQAPFGGNLFLWGEATTKKERRRFPGRSRKSYPKKHPWQVEPPSLRENLQDLFPHLEIDEYVEDDSSALLFLPTDEENEIPYPSEEWVIEEGDFPSPSESPSILPWEVWGLKIPLQVSFPLFSSSPDLFRESFHPGRELDYVHRAIGFARSLITRQRFIPALHRNSSGELEARWRPLYDLPQDEERLQKLADSAPACLFAAGEEGVNPFQKGGARASLKGFLKTVIDDRVRRKLSRANWNGTFKTKAGAEKNQAEGLRWLRKLGETGETDLELTYREDERLTRSYNNWIRAIKSSSGSNLRTGFKLVPPAEEEDGSPLFAAQDGWRLQFFLETVDSESFHLDAEELWSRGEGELAPLEERYGSPKKIFLKDLGVAAQLFSPIDSALKEEDPTGCGLTAAQAHSYLKEGYWLLKEAGFLTRVPSWWDADSLQTDAELGLKAKINRPRSKKSSSPSTGGGPGGWDSPLDFNWQLAIGEETISPEEFRKLADLKSPLVKVKDQWVELDPDDVERTIDFLEAEDGEELTLKETARKMLTEPTEAPLPVKDLEVGGERGEDGAKSWLDRLFPTAEEGGLESTGEPPEDFRGQLWEHQREGLGWLLSLLKRGFSPCLADDMGLGKTIQFLAALLKLKEESSSLSPVPSLLVCPTSVLGNWRREVERFAPSLDQLFHHGGDRLAGEEFLARARGSDLTITSYGLLRNDFSLLGEVDWNIIALDEAQKIKNPGTKTARRARKLPAKVRVALTGTPIENNLTELWSIMEFLNPGFLGPKTSFQKTFAKPIQRGEEDAGEKERTLKRLVDPFILSRKKTDPEILSDLPEKTEKKDYCSLTEEQTSLYQAVVDQAESELDKAEEEGDMKRRGCILSTIGKLKQICNHPAHFLGDDGFDPTRSGKIKRLVDICETIVEEGYSALLFTQYVEFGEMLRDFLQERFHYRVPFLHGGTRQKKRDQLMDEFQKQTDRIPFFLLSLRAGGLGVNLTEANHVIHIDRWWNPAVESQATDRAHRIGQERSVTVHKFVSSGTYEEEIDRMIESKKELAEKIVDSGEEGLTELSKEEFMNLVQLKEEAQR